MSEKTILQQLDGKPPITKAVPLGLQHVLAMFTGNLAPIIIVAGVLGLSSSDKIYLLQAAMFIAGVVTLIQIFKIGPIGSGLPIVMGTSFTFLGAAISIGLTYGYGTVMGACLIGGLFEMLVGKTFMKFKKFFPPIVSGIVVMSIGLTLIGVGADYFAGGVGSESYGSISNMLLGTTVFAIFILLNAFAKGMVKSSAILISLVVGYIIAAIMGIIDFTPVKEAAWFALPAIPLKMGLSFNLEAIILFVALFLITAVETIGDTHGVTVGGLNRAATPEEIRGSLYADGLGSSVAAIFGVMPNTSFSQNVGIVALTKCVNRFTVAVGIGFLLLLSFVPKLAAIVSVMPASVLGGAVIVVFALITVTGIRMIARTNLTGRNAIILAVALGVGFGLATAIGLNKEAFEAYPKAFHFIFQDKIFATGLVAFVLNIILPKDEDDAEVRAEPFEKLEEESKETA
ncbi:uracil-xanthine permease family protein [Vallitalea okinawensis]|uniref:uracil-xanthine permease family protein n=1 Tax=Vallitalea okinawensis TaxID=2078660 RepID=UPI000CFBFC06|nr:nucleobase:cation symporter-2 family protein [Vallitalea okinawensis]